MFSSIHLSPGIFLTNHNLIDLLILGIPSILVEIPISIFYLRKEIELNPQRFIVGILIVNLATTLMSAFLYGFSPPSSLLLPLFVGLLFLTIGFKFLALSFYCNDSSTNASTEITFSARILGAVALSNIVSFSLITLLNINEIMSYFDIHNFSANELGIRVEFVLLSFATGSLILLRNVRNTEENLKLHILIAYLTLANLLMYFVQDLTILGPIALPVVLPIMVIAYYPIIGLLVSLIPASYFLILLGTELSKNQSGMTARSTLFLLFILATLFTFLMLLGSPSIYFDTYLS